MTPRSKWPCQDKSGLDPGSQRLKVMPLPLERTVDAKGGEQAGYSGKEGGGAAVC